MKMTDLENVLHDYTRGDKPLDETNQALKELGCGLQLDPNRNVITQEELLATTTGENPPDTINGFGLMDHGVGCLEKVRVVDGHTVDVDMSEETAFVYIAGRCYRLRGNVLVEED